MSVFRDFQSAWAVRFPGCELPRAWEEDVRSNLSKHRARVTLLKEELEKEEFYVEYLERLLSDVERTRSESSSKKLSPIVRSGPATPSPKIAPKASPRTTTSVNRNNSTSSSVHSVESNNSSDNSQFVTVINVTSSPSSSTTTKTVSGSSSSAGSRQQPRASFRAINNGKTNATPSDKDKSSSSSSSPVTSSIRNGKSPTSSSVVILSSAKSANSQSNDNQGQSEKNGINSRKRPPTPPKKPKINRQNFPGLQFMGKEGFGVADNLSTPPSSLPPTPTDELEEDGRKSSQSPVIREEPLLTASRVIELIRPSDVTRKPSLPAADDIPAPVDSDTPLLRILSEIERGSNHSLASADLDDDPDEEPQLKEEPGDDIYDAVAPDEVTLEAAADPPSLDPVLDDLDRQSLGSNLSMTVPAPSYTNNSNDFANYVNIDYFLRREETSSKNDSDDNESRVSRSDLDDPVVVVDARHQPAESASAGPLSQDVFRDSDLYGAYYGVPSEMAADQLTETVEDKTVSERESMFKCIIKSITESEAAYVNCLNTLLQYMKAIKSTIGTTQPLVSQEDLSVIFYKIPELHSIHCQFLDGLKKLSDDSSQVSEEVYEDRPSLGDLFKTLASRLSAYSSFLKNYSRALERVQKCNQESNQFADITRSIKVKASMGQAPVTLEELLHKPVARVQKNALVLHDLIKYVTVGSDDHMSLSAALQMTQNFLNDLNIAATEQMFPTQDKTQRRLVKESFIIESTKEGNKHHRKLRHLFLFNDIIVCAKYRPSTRQKFTFDVKWYSLLTEVVLPMDEDGPSTKEKELSSDIMSLKTRLSSLRDSLSKEERAAKGGTSRALDKLKKKQAEIEGQLVLLLPQLPFTLGIKSGSSKGVYHFYLSSEYERTQWIESIKVLQTTSSEPVKDKINVSSVQAWIETCRKGLNPNLGSFLLRTLKDEDLLHGDLFIEIKSLKGVSRPADLFFVLEVDTYGHFFQKAATKVVRDSVELSYDQEFVVDLDGSQTLRILCYENVPGHPSPLFRGKASVDLSRSWLTDSFNEKDISILDSILSVSVKFVSSESSNLRFPAGKVYGSFGASITSVCKKEKSTIPYLIVGCVREVERRGLKEQGIYRVSGLNSDVQRLKKAFEVNPYEAEHLLKDIDIHAVTGLLKMYLRELPEALFTSNLYKKFFEAFNSPSSDEKNKKYISLFQLLPPVNQSTINFLIDHLALVNQFEAGNKMSLQNLATVFGPTMIRPSPSSSASSTSDSFTAGTIDVMAQAGILYFFLKKKVTDQSADGHSSSV